MGEEEYGQEHRNATKKWAVYRNLPQSDRHHD